MNTFAQHIATLIFVIFYFSSWRNKDVWVGFMAVSAIIGIVSSFIK